MRSAAEIVEALEEAAAQLEAEFPGRPAGKDTAGTLGWYQGKRAGIKHAILLLRIGEYKGLFETEFGTAHGKET